MLPSAVNSFIFDRKTPAFSVDAETGEIFAEPDLLAGIHRFNVSITNGNFAVHSLVTVFVGFFGFFTKFQTALCLDDFHQKK